MQTMWTTVNEIECFKWPRNLETVLKWPRNLQIALKWARNLQTTLKLRTYITYKTELSVEQYNMCMIESLY